MRMIPLSESAMQKKKVLIAAGGTGGHIFPALALAKQLSELSNVDVIFAGGNLANNRYFDKGVYPFHSTACGAFTSKNPLKLLQAMGKIGQGVWQGHRALADVCPDIAVGFGSYYTFPVIVAALLKRIPVVLHEANSIPGKVNRLLARYAHTTGIHFPETAFHLKGKTAVVGMPLRPGFKKDHVTKEEAKAYFQLKGDKPVLLVFGGSQGAQAINEALLQALASPLGQQFQVIHMTGHPEMAERARSHYRKHGIEAAVKEFETRMEMAWQAADLVISRSGAGTISEAIEFEVPALLIPFPRAADNHQELNADFMVKTVGGAEKLLERDLNSERLRQLIADAKLHEWRVHIVAYKREKNNQDLVGLIREILG